jgi:hypothetical protein
MRPQTPCTPCIHARMHTRSMPMLTRHAHARTHRTTADRSPSTPAGCTASSSIRRRPPPAPTTRRSGACGRRTAAGASTSGTGARRTWWRRCGARRRCVVAVADSRVAGHMRVGRVWSARGVWDLAFSRRSGGGCTKQCLTGLQPAAFPPFHQQDGQPIPLHASGLPVTAKPLVDGGKLYDQEGVSVRAAKHRSSRIVAPGGTRCSYFHACVCMHGGCMGVLLHASGLHGGRCMLMATTGS